MREDSAILIDGVQRGTMQRCPHCQGHFLVAAAGDLDLGRGAFGNLAQARTWCQNCGRLTCGRSICDPVKFCIPAEAQLEHQEGKLNKYTELIKVRGIV